jgi:hypothetical protein
MRTALRTGLVLLAGQASASYSQDCNACLAQLESEAAGPYPISPPLTQQQKLDMCMCVATADPATVCAAAGCPYDWQDGTPAKGCAFNGDCIHPSQSDEPDCVANNAPLCSA